MKKNLVKIISFLVIWILLLNKFHEVFKFKYGDGIYGLNNFYLVEENSIDVMFFGSSHIFEDVNTGVLWDEFGIASYDLCGSIQPLWNTYYYMKEALKTQKPKLMVLDCYCATLTVDFTDSSRIIKNNYGLKLSLDKINSIKVSSPKSEYNNYMLEYPTYHSRYDSDISYTDFIQGAWDVNCKYWKGHGINTLTTEFSKCEGIDNIKDTEQLTYKAETYLRKIIELSKENNIPLVMIVTPYPLNPTNNEHIRQLRIYNRVSEIAAEYEIPFINYNYMYDEIGLDFSRDFADTDHLNYNGNPKFTKYLGKWIKENYEIPDRRGNNNYSDYDIMAKDCRMKIYNQELRDINDIGNWLNKAQCEDYLLVYTISGDYKNMDNYEDVKNELKLFNVDLEKVRGDSVWIVKNGELLFASGDDDRYCWYKDIGENDCLTVTNSDSLFEMDNKEPPIIKYNNTIMKPVQSGLTVFVYDTFTQTYVETVGFSINNGNMSYSKISK